MPTKELTILPVGPRVMIKPILPAKKEKKSAGIILPDSIKDEPERTHKGEVVAVGDGFKQIVPKVGMKVIFNLYSPIEVKDGEEKYLIVPEEDIVAVCQ
jgi:chaperonin GroES